MSSHAPGAGFVQSHVHVGTGCVRKEYLHSNDAEMERVKSQAALRVAESTGLFDTPEILGFGFLSTTWRFVPDLLPLGRELSARADRELARSVGRVLAHIHSGLLIDPRIASRADDPLDEDIVPIHGDFSLNNLQYQRSTGRIVVLDWSPARWLGKPITHASQHLDMSVMLADLFYQRPGDPGRIHGPENLAREFLAGYGEVRDPRAQRLPKVARHVLHLYWKGAVTGWRRTLRIPYLFRLHIWLARLEKEEGGRGHV